MYEAVTHQVKVTVEPTFDPERSDPDERRYFWRYAIEIVNLGDKSVTLMERHWRITDAAGRHQHVADALLQHQGTVRVLFRQLVGHERGRQLVVAENAPALRMNAVSGASGPYASMPSRFARRMAGAMTRISSSPNIPLSPA